MAPSFVELQVAGLRGDSEYFSKARSRSPSPESYQRHAPEAFIGLAGELELIERATPVEFPKTRIGSGSPNGKNAVVKSPIKPIRSLDKKYEKITTRTIAKASAQVKPRPLNMACENIRLRNSNKKSLTTPTAPRTETLQKFTSCSQSDPSEIHHKRNRSLSARVEDQSDEDWNTDRSAWRVIHGLRKRPRTEYGFAYYRRYSAYEDVLYGETSDEVNTPTLHPTQFITFEDNIEKTFRDDPEFGQIFSPNLLSKALVPSGDDENDPALDKQQPFSKLMASARENSPLFFPDNFEKGAEDSLPISSTENKRPPQISVASIRGRHIRQASSSTIESEIAPGNLISNPIQSMISKGQPLQVMQASTKPQQNNLKSLSALQKNPYAKSIMQGPSFNAVSRPTMANQQLISDHATLENVLAHLRNKQAQATTLCNRTNVATIEGDEMWERISTFLKDNVTGPKANSYAFLGLAAKEGDRKLSEYLEKLQKWDNEIEKLALLKKKVMYTLQLQELERIAKGLGEVTENEKPVKSKNQSKLRDSLGLMGLRGMVDED